MSPSSPAAVPQMGASPRVLAGLSDSQGLQSSSAPASAPEAPREVFLSASVYSAVQEQLSVLVTAPWICPMIVSQTHLAPVSAKVYHKWQSRAGISDVPFPSSVPGHELAWARGQRRKGQPARITGGMRPSEDVTATGATLLSEVIRIKLQLCGQSCTGSFRLVHLGWVTFL